MTPKQLRDAQAVKSPQDDLPVYQKKYIFQSDI